MTRNVDLEKLEYYAPEVLLACRAALIWLEKSEQVDALDSMVAADVRFAIEKLQEAGVTLPTREDYAYSEEELQALENETSYEPELVEMNELLKRIAVNQGKLGIPHYKVKEELAEFNEQLRQKYDKTAAKVGA